MMLPLAGAALASVTPGGRVATKAGEGTLNAQRATLNAERSTLNAERSTLNAEGIHHEEHEEHEGERGGWWRLRWLPLLAVPALYFQPLPRIFDSHLKPCALYLPRVAPLSRRLGVETRACDTLTLRNLADHPVLIRLRCDDPASGFQVIARPLQRELVMRLDPGADTENPRPRIVTREPPSRPLEIEMALLTPGGEVRRRARFAPWDRPGALRVWRATGLPGIEFRWMGGALLLPQPEQVRQALQSE
jgi:hypothetical protein